MKGIVYPHRIRCLQEPLFFKKFAHAVELIGGHQNVAGIRPRIDELQGHGRLRVEGLLLLGCKGDGHEISFRLVLYWRWENRGRANGHMLRSEVSPTE